ncbi:MAG: esterase, partial [Chthonomonadales bacterium]|nr:esterase [Chthonomonadales bacterium]
MYVYIYPQTLSEGGLGRRMGVCRPVSDLSCGIVCYKESEVQMSQSESSVAASVVSAPTTSTNKIAIYALVMKGGGVKGLALAGAISELEHYYDFSCFVGTSAGAITAVLLSAGFTGDELVDELQKKDFMTFLDGKPYRYLYDLALNKGLHSGLPLINWIAEKIHVKLKKVCDVEVSELPKRVVLYASNVDNGPLTFDGGGGHRGEHCDNGAAHAARCSLAIPYFFRPEHVGGRRAYDGGMLHNYPLG